jgi:hypothetical protein
MQQLYGLSDPVMDTPHKTLACSTSRTVRSRIFALPIALGTLHAGDRRIADEGSKNKVKRSNVQP